MAWEERQGAWSIWWYGVGDANLISWYQLIWVPRCVFHSCTHSLTHAPSTWKQEEQMERMRLEECFSLDLRTSQDQKHGNTQKQSMILVTHGDTTWQSATACYWDCCMSTRLGMRMVADSASGWIGKERSRSWGIASAGKRDSARMARMARIRTPMISNVLLPVVARCGTHISHMNEGTLCSMLLCTGRPTSTQFQSRLLFTDVYEVC